MTAIENIVNRADRRPAALRRHPDASALLALALLACALMSPYLLSPNAVMWPRSGLGSDLTTYNWPPAYYIRQHLAATGTFPLWWDTTLGGLPLVGNPGVRIFYPPFLLAILLPLPLFWGFAWVNTLSLWIAGAGVYALLRWTTPASRYAALTAGLLMVLTPRLSANIVGDMGYTAGLCWTPLTLACVRAALDRRSWRWGIAAGLCLAMLFTLNFVVFLYLGLLVVPYTAVQLVAVRREKRHRLLGTGAVMALVFLGAAAFMLFPLVTFLPYQSRQALTLAESNYLALPLPLLVEFLFPSPLKFPEWTFYVGLLPLVLAGVGLRHPARREAMGWAAVFLFALAFSLGTTTPLYAAIINVVPGFRLMRVPSRMLFFLVLALIVLSALGLDRALKQRQPPSRSWIAAGAVLGVATMAARYLMRSPDEPDWLLGSLAAISVVVGTLALCEHFVRARVIIPLCLLIELLPLAASYRMALPYAQVFATPAVAAPIIEDREAGGLFRVFGTQRELPDHILTLHGLQSADGLNSFQFTHYVDLMRAASGCPLQGITAAVPACVSAEILTDASRLMRPNINLLSLLNVRYVLASFDLLPAVPALRLVGQDGDQRLYLNDSALPRAFAVGEVMPNDVPLTDIDPRRSALADLTPFTSGVPVIPADIHESGGGRFRLSIEVPAPMLLVISETWVPGWAARVDGEPVTVRRVNSAMLGIPLPAGAHQIEAQFLPPTFTAGLAVSAGTLLFSGAALLFGKRRSSRAGAAVITHLREKIGRTRQASSLRNQAVQKRSGRTKVRPCEAQRF